MNYRELINNRRFNSRWKRLTWLLSIVVVIGTVSVLMLPAITLSQYGCGLTEHTHTSDCYVQSESAVLSCAYETPDEYVESETAETVETEETHQHMEECYVREQVLVCELEEHTHDESCIIKTLEDSEWQALMPKNFTDDWAYNLVLTAQSQIGYRESATETLNDEMGIAHGATMYGEAAQDPYGPWNTAFMMYCIDYVGISKDVFPVHYDIVDWQTQLKDNELLLTGEPSVGDIVFIDTNDDDNADVVGLLAKPVQDSAVVGIEGDTLPEVCVILGDYEDTVAQIAYNAETVTGYASVSDAQDRYDEFMQENPDLDGYSRTYKDEYTTITVSWGAEANLPKNTVFTASPIGPENDAFNTYFGQVKEMLDMGEIVDIKFLDLTFTDQDGQEIEPEAPVSIKVEYDTELYRPVGTQYTVLHFGENGIEQLDADVIAEEEAITGIEFSQNSFSVDAIVVSEEVPDGMGYVPSGTYGRLVASEINMGEGMNTDRQKSDPVTVNDWKYYLPSDKGDFDTEYAGGIINDKSVTTTVVTYKNEDGVTGTITANEDEFLVGLSTMGSTQTVSGVKSAPTDVMFILDMSSSMYGGGSTSAAERHTRNVQPMVDALNKTIANLNYLNEYNRIGVVIYYGYSNVITQSDNTHSFVLMPLDRYTAGSSGTFLTVDTTGSKLDGISVSAGVKSSDGNTYSAKHTIKHGHSGAEYVAGTYAQAGILNAMDEFLGADTTVTDINGTVMPRRPVYVFMSDGEPTAATENYTGANEPASDGTKQYARMGNNVTTGRNSAQSDFVTQLSAAYAKEMVARHYTECQEEPLYYTLGLGDELSLDVMDPTYAAANNTVGVNDDEKGDTTIINITSRITDYWQNLVNSGEVSFTTRTYKHNSWTMETRNHTVSKVNLDSATKFPSSVAQQFYVDKYFSAQTASDLENAFNDIMLEISLQQEFEITETTGPNNSGHVTFIDTIGEYMHVTEVEGIILNGELYTGDELAKNFLEPGVSGEPAEGNKLGQLGQPTAMGTAFVKDVATQLGLNPEKDYQYVAKMIDAAYHTGQLSWSNENNFSNCIEWWASVDSATGAHTFIGFHHEGGTEACEYDCAAEKHYSIANPPEGATYLIRSYFYIGTVTGDESGSHYDSNMMYAMAWVRTEIATGQESVIFALPNALIPTIDYEIGLDQDKNIIRLESSGAASPAMLCYQVGLKENVDVNEIIAEGTYSGIVKDESGEVTAVNFYTNDFDLENGYALNNTFVYFTPDIQNDRYYYTGPINEVQGEPTPIYVKTCSDADCTNDEHYSRATYIGDPDITAYYERYIYYSKSGETLAQHVKYKRISVSVFDKNDSGAYTSIQEIGGYQYIKAGTPHSMTNETLLNNFAVPKTNNTTGTSGYSDLPYSNPGHNTGDGRYIIGAMLGNNGQLGVSPVAFSGTKSMAGVDLKNYNFNFELYVTDSSFTIADGAIPLETVQNVGASYNEIEFSPLWHTYTGDYYYVVREVDDASNDYVIYDKSQYNITVSVGGTTSVTAVKVGEDTQVAANQLNFTNKIGTRLPNTGGVGKEPYIISGLALIIGVALVYINILKKRRREEN